MIDPIIEEIRAIRARLDREIRENPEQFQKEIQDIGRRFRDRLVQHPPLSGSRRPKLNGGKLDSDYSAG